MHVIVPPLAIGLGLVITAMCRGDAASSPRSSADDPTPNIVLILIDTVRSDHLGCYGYARDTSPFIDGLAAEGTLFEACYSPASWTFPATMSLMTGLLPAAHGCIHGTEVLSREVGTLAEALAAEGYVCGGVVSNPQLNSAFGFGRGYVDYDDDTIFEDAELRLLDVEIEARPRPIQDIVTSHTITDLGLTWAERALKGDKPMFLFLLYFDPHDNYLPPPPLHRKFDATYRGRMDGRGIREMRNDPPFGPDLAHLQARYDGEIYNTDAEIARFVNELHRRTDPGNTLIILLSDHGEAFGEHGKMQHGNSPHVEEVRVPMIWHWPGRIAKGHRVSTPVTLTDVPATIKEMLGLARRETFEPVQGRSLLPALRGERLEPRPILSQRARGNGFHLALTEGSDRLHARFKRSVRERAVDHVLYDLAADPEERWPVSDQARTQAMNATMSAIWDRCKAIHATFDGDAVQEEPALNEQEMHRLRDLGYTAGDSSTAPNRGTGKAGSATEDE